jgi:hypothetical protein
LNIVPLTQHLSSASESDLLPRQEQAFAKNSSRAQRLALAPPTAHRAAARFPFLVNPRTWSKSCFRFPRAMQRNPGRPNSGAQKRACRAGKAQIRRPKLPARLPADERGQRSGRVPHRTHAGLWSKSERGLILRAEAVPVSSRTNITVALIRRAAFLNFDMPGSVDFKVGKEVGVGKRRSCYAITDRVKVS